MKFDVCFYAGFVNSFIVTVLLFSTNVNYTPKCNLTKE